MSFKNAGRLGFREAMAQAGPILLEPVSLVEVSVPAELQGEVMGDLNARRGRVQGTEMGDRGEQTIVALVPTAELRRYAIDLRSLTSGRGRYRAHHDHYDTVPAHLVDAVRREVDHREH
jgi:elongation factor G